jgi:hypothetical protein
MGVQFPLPAPSILFVFNSFSPTALTFSDISGTNWVQCHILRIFNRLRVSSHYSSPATLYIVSAIYA